MRIMLAGKSRYGALVFEALRIMPDVRIVRGAVTTVRPDDKLALRMAGYGIPTMPLARLADPSLADVVHHAGVDLIVLANVNTKMHRAGLHVPRHGAICYHPSYLPEFRGADAVRQQVAAGVTASGVSIFVPTDGLDEGPIVNQLRVHVPAGIDASTMYHNHLVPAGVALMVEAVQSIQRGTATMTPQADLMVKAQPHGDR